VTPDRRATEASLGRAGPVLYELTASHRMSLCGGIHWQEIERSTLNRIVFAAQRKGEFEPSTWVPLLGRDWIESSPPTSRSGSRMLRRPRPSVFSIAPDSKSRSESLIRKRTQLESPANSTRIWNFHCASKHCSLPLPRRETGTGRRHVELEWERCHC